MDQAQSSDITPGQRLRQYREAADLSQRQLAALTGIDRSKISHWESDHYVPSASALMQLGLTLEIPASELFRVVGLPVPETSISLPAMLRREYDLPPEAIAEIQREIERVAKKYTKDKRKRAKEGDV